MKIIIVDDNKTFRDTLKMILTEKFHHEIIEEAESGTEILKSEQTDRVDVILMDIMMSDKDGIETTKELLKENSNLKIIAVTMHTEKAYLEELVYAGFKGCIPKKNIFDEIDVIINDIQKGEYSFPSSVLRPKNENEPKINSH